MYEQVSKLYIIIDKFKYILHNKYSALAQKEKGDEIVKKEEIAKASGGWRVAPNGHYWLKAGEKDLLKSKGFQVGTNLNGWEDVNSDSDIKGYKSYCVNYGGGPASIEDIVGKIGFPDGYFFDTSGRKTK